MRALDRLLLNPHVQRLGGVQALAGAGVLAWGLVKGLDPLIIVGGLLCAANVALFVFWPKRHLAAGANRSDGAKFGPAERRERLDNLFYPPRDDRRELGERCASFATRVRALVEEYKEGHAANLAAAYVELLESDPDLDREQARENAEQIVERNVIGTYALMHREEGLELFDKAREEGVIVAKLRREVQNSEAYALDEVPNIFRVMARRLGIDVPEPDPPEPPPLAAKLDDLLREGMDLAEELSVPVKPEKTPDGTGWRVDGGPPDGWWEKAGAFEQRARDLLHAEHPALLEAFARGHNGFLRKEREADVARDKPDPNKDKRPDALKALEFANSSRSGPADKMEAILGGLAAARLELGKEAVQ